MKTSIKRIVIFFIILLLFIVYTLAMDPDTNILSNLPYGAGLLLSLQVVLMFALGLAVVEIITDFFTDRYFKFLDDPILLENIKRDPKAIATYMLAWSLRIVGYSVMFGLIVISYIGSR